MCCRSNFFLRLILLSFFLGIHSGCILKKCEVLTVLDKSKCTFDREAKARVCVAKLGKIENFKNQSIRGRSVSTLLPEPLEPFVTEVEMCRNGGKRVFNKL